MTRHLALPVALLFVACALSACSSVDGDIDPDGVDDTFTNDAVSDTTADAEVQEPPRAPEPGELLIEELYYSGASPAGGADHYFSDQFIELVNASEATLDLSGVMIGEVYGGAGAINPGMEPDSYAQSRPEEVVMTTVWRIPDGALLPPEGRLLIAHDGTNHRPFSTIDLSGADFEAFVAESERDTDHPTVANLEVISFQGGFDWLLTVFGASVVVLEAGAELSVEAGPFGQELRVAPAGAVLDAVEALMDADSGDFKRLPQSVDAGFAFVSGTYVGRSLHRRRGAEGWLDTDDSSADFEPGPPEPGLAVTAGEVEGEGWIELGTGVVDFATLAEGGELALVEGLQGGWHLDVALRFGGFGPDGVLLIYEALSAQAEPISYTTQTELRAASVLEEEEGWARVGDRVVLDILDAAEVIDTTVVLRVTAELDGQTWSDERSVRVVSGP